MDAPNVKRGLLQRMPWKNSWFIALLGLAAVMGLACCLKPGPESTAYTGSIGAVVLWAAWCGAMRLLTRSGLWSAAQRYLAAGWGLAAAFTLAMALGLQLDTQGQVLLRDPALYGAVLTVSLAAAPGAAALMAALANAPAAPRRAAAPARTFFVIWLALLAVYGLVLAILWPGTFAYDAEWELSMVQNGAYTTHHPLLHVLLLGGIVEGVRTLTGSWTVAVGVFTLVQMAVTAACLAYMLYTLRRLGVRRPVWWLCAGYLALFPTVHLFITCSTKDVLFSAGVVLLSTLLLEMTVDTAAFWASHGRRVLFTAASLLMVLFRNNGIYAYGVFALVFIFVCRQYWKQWLAAVLCVLLGYAGMTWGLGAALNVKSAGRKEMLSVTAQQLARVYVTHPETFRAEDLEQLFTYLPPERVTSYNPKCADHVKEGFSNEALQADFMGYLRLWARIGLRRPGVYLNAFLVNTYQYWYPDTVLDGYHGRDGYDNSSYFEFRVGTPEGRASLFPAGEEWYRLISREIYVQHVPVVGVLFACGFWHWLFLLTAVYLWARGARRTLLALLPMGLVYLTALLGPIVLVRYVLYFFFGAPLLLALLLDANAFLPSERKTP